MSVTKDEHLSALVDDEAGDFERRRTLDGLVADQDSRERWGRYHLIGDVMRGDAPVALDVGFADRVLAAIQDEEMEAVPASARAQRFAKPVAGFAMAASVAVATVLGVQGFTTQSTPGETGATLMTAQTPAVVPSGIRQVAVTTDTLASANDGRAAEMADLNSYLVRHAEYAARHGMLPQVRVVGYEAEGK